MFSWFSPLCCRSLLSQYSNNQIHENSFSSWWSFFLLLSTSLENMCIWWSFHFAFFFRVWFYDCLYFFCSFSLHVESDFSWYYRCSTRNATTDLRRSNDFASLKIYCFLSLWNQGTLRLRISAMLNFDLKDLLLITCGNWMTDLISRLSTLLRTLWKCFGAAPQIWFFDNACIVFFMWNRTSAQVSIRSSCFSYLDHPSSKTNISSRW